LAHRELSGDNGALVVSTGLMHMIRSSRLAALLAAASTLLCAAFPSPAQGAPDAQTIAALAAKDKRPVFLLPPPPPAGSPGEREELDQVHRIVAAASPERLAQARADALENPGVFNAALGADLRTLPLTMAFIVYAIDDGRPLVLAAKNHFHRLRPWAVDTTLPNCAAGLDKQKDASYPSAHAMLGYGLGMILARLAPERAPALLERAREYGYSRLVCGEHFASDIEAGHVLAAAQTERLFDDPALQAKIAAVRAELRAAHVITQ
jgi:acid phosphatase (class A)